MKSFFNDYPEHIVSPLTINGDTALHIAAYSESKDLLQHLVDLLPPSSICWLCGALVTSLSQQMWLMKKEEIASHLRRYKCCITWDYFS